MKVQYDPETDTLTIRLREERIKESEEVRPGVIADYGYDGGVVRFEVLCVESRGKGHRDAVCSGGIS